MEKRRNFVNKYSISNYGRIRNDITGRVLKLTPNRRGYLRTTISVNHTLKTVFPHRLVALYFVPNPNNYPIVNHIDNNSKNNNYWNLEWCTYQYNTQHAIKIGAMNFENNHKLQKLLEDTTLISQMFVRVKGKQRMVIIGNMLTEICYGSLV